LFSRLKRKETLPFPVLFLFLTQGLEQVLGAAFSFFFLELGPFLSRFFLWIGVLVVGLQICLAGGKIFFFQVAHPGNDRVAFLFAGWSSSSFKDLARPDMRARSFSGQRRASRPLFSRYGLSFSFFRKTSFSKNAIIPLFSSLCLRVQFFFPPFLSLPLSPRRKGLFAKETPIFPMLML